MTTRWLALALAALTVADAALGAAVWRRRQMSANGPAFGRAVPTLRREARAWPSCEVLRYSASGCPFCTARAAASWRKIAGVLAAHGCEVTETTPFGGDFPLDGLRAPHRLAITVRTAFAAAMRFARTPTTALLIRGRVAWEHVGLLDQEADRKVLAAAGVEMGPRPGGPRRSGAPARARRR